MTTPTEAAAREIMNACEAAIDEWLVERNRHQPVWRKQSVTRVADDRLEVTIARPDKGATSFDTLEISIREKTVDSGAPRHG
jgi:hypothetical protein